MSTPEQDTAPGLEREETPQFVDSTPVIAPSQRALTQDVLQAMEDDPEVDRAYAADNAVRCGVNEDDAMAGLAVADVVFDKMEHGGGTRYQYVQTDDPLAALAANLPPDMEDDPEPRQHHQAQVIINGAPAEEDDEDDEDDQDEDDAEEEVPVLVPDNHRISPAASIVDEREAQARRTGDGVLGYTENGFYDYTPQMPAAPDLSKQYPELKAHAAHYDVQMPVDDAEETTTQNGTTVVQDRDTGTISVAELQKSLQGIATLAAHAFSSVEGCKTLERNLDALELHEGHTRTRNGIMSGYAAGFEDGYRTAIRRLAELDPLPAQTQPQQTAEPASDA